MIKLMRFTNTQITMIGLRIKVFTVFLGFILMGCPKDESLAYKAEIKNMSSANLFVTRKIDGFNPNDDLSGLTFEIVSGLGKNLGLRELETDNPVTDFLEGWGGNNRFRIYKNDTLLVDWRGPAYSGEEEDHNFYNINAWEVDDTPKSFDVIYTITFTINPEDLKQDETD